MRIVGEEEIKRAFDLDGALALIRSIYQMAARGAADVSSPAALSLRGANGTSGRFKVKGAVLDDLNVAGFRLIGDADPAHGRDHAYCYLVDPRTMEPLALVDEEWLHGVRTALTGVVAVEALGPSVIDDIAIVGTGRIARHLASFLAKTHPKARITLASRSAERAASAAGAWSEEFATSFHTAASVPEAVGRASVVVTVSDADERLFGADDLRPGTLVCAMGGRREFERDVFDRADRLIVDEIDFVCTAGNVASWIASGTATRAEMEAQLDATIGEVLAERGSITTGTNEVCLAVIQGMAICDIGLAKWILDRSNGGA
ncbi:MAG: NAD(P)-binding domain-containing protein [Microvirga sp.]|nr:NAD(P)-binding domain-containing protein [Microvirga sp.]